MRWLVALVALIVALSPVMALADTSDNVTIIAVPDFVGGLITSFTATYIDQQRVDLAWTYSAGVTGVVVRAKYGSLPSSVTDGRLVYSGIALAFSDILVDFDEEPDTIYYKIWGQTLPGVYPSSMFGSVESEIVLMMLFFGGGLAALIAAYVIRKPLICVIASGLWLLGGFYSYTLSTKNWASWDVYLGLALFGLILAIVALLVITALREKTESLDEVLTPSETEQFANEYSEMQKAWSIFKTPPPKEGKGDW